MKKFLPVIIFLVIVLIFFKPFFFNGLLPIPSDTIVGLYHPFRDLYTRQYPNGIPFKNFLITDPVRQQFPWRYLAIEVEKHLQLPLWNPYNFSGTPLLANFQSAVLYPLNFLFFFLPFSFAWSLLIFLEPLLGGVFLFLYIRNHRLHSLAALLGAISFAFSGFFIAWLEWNTVVHVIIWLPLILLSIDKTLFYFQFSKNSKFKIQNSKLQFKIKNYYIWLTIFVFALIFAFLAGHLQMFFYLYVVSIAYFFSRWIQIGNKKQLLVLFLLLNFCFLILTAIQWIPTLQFISHSARNVDQENWQKLGWFVPWQHLVQFVAPDFFGNPTTLNYWGVWNYGELVGYIGVFPLLMSLFALFFRRDKKTLFFGCIFFLSLIFALPTFFAKIPYQLAIPFFSSSQPTRLLFLTDFSLCILGSLGFDYFLKNKKGLLYPWIFLSVYFLSILGFIFIAPQLHVLSIENILIAKHNIFFPITIFVTNSLVLLLIYLLHRKNVRIYFPLLYVILVVITIVDLLRFAQKFTPFTSPSYLYPTTQTISFLQQHLGNYRFMTTDDRILPPNFSAVYHVQSVEGYDPLYLQSYGELIAASQRGKPDIHTPFGFNRIITPHNYDSKIIDLLGVKYVLSLSNIQHPKLQKVFQEGQTQIYENKQVLPRAFFVSSVQHTSDKQQTINTLFDVRFDMRKNAVVLCSSCDDLLFKKTFKQGSVSITQYSANFVKLNTINDEDGFLLITDTFYPTWHATVDGAKTKIYRTDYNFRGLIVPKGNHIIIFSDRLF